MKLRDSGMPEERFWESLFDVGLILSALGINSSLRDVAEFGCGYGTFTIPIANAVSGLVYTFDLDPAMISRTEKRAIGSALGNVICRERDVMEQGFGLVPGSVDAVLLFNILHCENPQILLVHAAEVTRIGGSALVIHWRSDPSTPRGPSLDIRPRPEQIVRWAEETGKLAPRGETLDLPPWHFGLQLLRA